jgi:hypothetical protein
MGVMRYVFREGSLPGSSYIQEFKVSEVRTINNEGQLYETTDRVISIKVYTSLSEFNSSSAEYNQ